VVIPFSEGLDSRSVAGLMAKEYGSRLIRVRLGTKTDDRPMDPSGRKSPFTAVPYKVRRCDYRFPETSARSRGFKFALLSGLAAYLAKADLIIQPESGQGALGPALVPVGQAYEDYRNHPLFTAKMSVFLKALLGGDIRFEFPRLWHTKGETLREYVFGSSQPDWADTRSCWQDNRNVSVDSHRRQCGVCAACMLRRLSVHAAGLSEAPETYVWEDLRVASFENGAVARFRKTSAQRNYAVAGALHLDHLAGLRRSRIHRPGLESCIRQTAAARGKPELEVRTGLDRLLACHEKEWKEFMEFLGPKSFVSRWTEGVHDHAA
jgi:7-cyano-7-deazaguanine synthase in queuosine biosynthesis